MVEVKLNFFIIRDFSRVIFILENVFIFDDKFFLILLM